MPQMVPTPPAFRSWRLLGNLIAVAALVLAAAYLIDWLWTVFGGAPWASCGLLSWVDGFLAPALGLAVFAIGVIVLAYQGGKSNTGLALIIAGVILGATSGLMESLGWNCI